LRCLLLVAIRTSLSSPTLNGVTDRAEVSIRITVWSFD